MLTSNHVQITSFNLVQFGNVFFWKKEKYEQVLGTPSSTPQWIWNQHPNRVSLNAEPGGILSHGKYEWHCVKFHRWRPDSIRSLPAAASFRTPKLNPKLGEKSRRGKHPFFPLTTSHHTRLEQLIGDGKQRNWPLASKLPHCYVGSRHTGAFELDDRVDKLIVGSATG
jgi:hypothetical protein